MSSLLNLAWLIPLFPFLAFVAVSLFAHRDRKLSHGLVLGGIAVALLLSQIVFWVAVLGPESVDVHPFQSVSIHWLSAGVEDFRLGVYIDAATTVMLFMVPLVCAMIFIYSVGYMRGDPRYSRFFAYISLFATGMLGMVVFDSLLAFFIFWEIMGTCSYLLIGFWYEKESAKKAGLKAFLVTKIGDLFFMLGLVLLYSEVGSLAYREIFAEQTLHHLANTLFLGTGIPVGAVIALLLFGGTVGKSAQFPLHVWLPDAMEGPTPVSALIHAATMVSAGVFLVVRMFPLFQQVQVLGDFGTHMTVVAAVGAFTAIFSSIIAVAQNDIKRVLAFSTISQLGYMVAALGIGAYVAGAFHLITHAFFKALLFLSSGSVIHGMEHGHHHVHQHGGHTDDAHGEFDPNDMRNMGGLWKRMPRTFWTFLIGGLALSGFPLITAGFWSKDEILAQAYGPSRIVFWALVIAAGLTAFYTARQICMTFLGKARTKAAEHVPESVPSMTVPLMVLAFFAITLGWAGIPDEFPVIGPLIPNWFHHFVGSVIEGGHVADQAARVAGHLSQVAAEQHSHVPLIMGLTFALGGLALGWLVYGRKPMQAGEMDRLEAGMRKLRLGWLYEAMQERFYMDEAYQATFVRGSIWLADLFDAFDYGQSGKHGVVDGMVMLAGRVGRALARVSDWFDSRVVDALVNLVGRMGRRLAGIGGAFDVRVIDRLVDLAGMGARAVSEGTDAFDTKVIDGAVDGVSDSVKAGGRFLRRIQTGRVQTYLLLAALAVVALAATFLAIVLLEEYLWQLSVAAVLLVAALVVAFAIQSRRREKESLS
jgi:NADH-quinone oxidoreductase subunit L